MRYPIAIVVAAACASCSFWKPRADPTMFYVLTQAASPPAASPAGCAAARVVGLGPIRLPEYLDRSQLVTRVAANQLRISEFERWAEPLGDAFASTLRQDLAATLPSDAIVVYPWNAPTHPDVEIAIDVLRFERVSDRAVEVAARWTIRDATGQVRFDQRVTRPQRHRRRRRADGRRRPQRGAVDAGSRDGRGSMRRSRAPDWTSSIGRCALTP